MQKNLDLHAKKSPEDLIKYLYNNNLVNDFWRAVMFNKYGYSAVPVDGSILSDGNKKYYFKAAGIDDFTFELPRFTPNVVQGIITGKVSFVPILIFHRDDRNGCQFLYPTIPSNINVHKATQNIIFNDFINYTKIETIEDINEVIENGKWLCEEKFDESLGPQQVSKFLS